MASILVPIFVIFSIVVGMSCLVKASAFIVSKSKVSWKHCFIFSIILLIFSPVVGLLRSAIGNQIPSVFFIFIGVALEALMACLYFQSRAFTPENIPVGKLKGSLIGVALFSSGMLISVALYWFVTVFFNP